MSEELKLDPDVTREDAYNWFKSERQARFQVKKELEVLQDAIADYSEAYDCKFHGEEHVLIVNAIEASRQRRKNNE
jgi:hypothetical protein